MSVSRLKIVVIYFNMGHSKGFLGAMATSTTPAPSEQAIDSNHHLNELKHFLIKKITLYNQLSLL